MQTLPMIVICGRPNVGKSTLFNVLAKRRISIIDPSDGVTRDRVITKIELGDKHYHLVDTGGIGLKDEFNLGEMITKQAFQGIDQASLLLLMVDVQVGITPLDMEVAGMIKKNYSHKTVWVIANKSDYPKLILEREEFQKMGFGEPICISAAHYQGIGELKQKIIEYFANIPSQEESHIHAPAMKIAVVGKVNSGKSTLINSLAQEDRVIVSEVPGTTRDSIDIYFEKDGMTLVAIDTAGLRRNKGIRSNVDFYSQNRAQKAIRRADVVIFLFDASTHISNIDKQIAQYIRKEYKPAIITINKWDLAKEKANPQDYEKYLTKNIPELNYAPMSFITAKTGKNVNSTIDVSRNLFKQAQRRVSTGELNRILRQQILAKKSPPTVNGKQGKILYATQVGVTPPAFVLFVNDPQVITPKYERYLFNQFQSQLGFPEIPVKFEIREKTSALPPE